MASIGEEPEKRSLHDSSENGNGTSAKPKKLKTNGHEPASNGSEPAAHVEIEEKDVFKNIEFVKLLKSDAARKTAFIQGVHQDGKDAVIILEQPAFNVDNIDKIFEEAVPGSLKFQNDCYHNYSVSLNPQLNAAKLTLIHPAEKHHLEKFTTQIMHLVEETPEAYQNITLPCVKRGRRFSTAWVDNILAHEKETDRIVFEDADKDTGFVLLPDLKWDGKNVDSLYLIALTHKHILSIRELTAEHLPMLRNLKEKGTKAIADKYGLPASRIRAFFHYQPTFYHLHVHFTNVQFDAPGRNVEKAHMLTSVISNLETDPDYYRKAIIPFLVGEQDPLHEEYFPKNKSLPSESE